MNSVEFTVNKFYEYPEKLYEHGPGFHLVHLFPMISLHLCNVNCKGFSSPY